MPSGFASIRAVCIRLGAADAGCGVSLRPSALAWLRQALQGHKVIVIAAADLAHIGPAFGDPIAAGFIQRILSHMLLLLTNAKPSAPASDR